MRLHPPWLRLASRLPALPCLPEARWFPAYTSRLGMTVASQVPNFRIPSSTHLNPSSLVYPLTHSTGRLPTNAITDADMHIRGIFTSFLPAPASDATAVLHTASETRDYCILFIDVVALVLLMRLIRIFTAHK
ncbi:hypothetical protein FGSG_12146 [Fusarium graminearum PH-1]|uniref:Chromosome 1, complete genome n=1 Tax=Gibberella zeae (strain ATCC MYA-4620 / CBS 123657 / FGSC 9075 / NRRL 31084 / PH-1) TaxID=229533 RepID=I1S5M5_GIBZE|nr:hypothetical protein FGSG_12146 [Fusarium graminearum PH-1]ESU07914.1 hypothetical protein FGSG_12146 [Fusarium graminearum PH-1]CEF74771.1 unnamed protein product [Fusarium graminearum]|eukprot:XP_011318399.1 hypothetical protein FGSG_12146 [Fusarium graminearum PH-1]